MSRIIGCEQLYIAKVTKDELSGTTWEAPKRVPSLISIDVTDQKDTVTYYSDNQIEQVIPSFSGKEVEIVLGYLDNELEAEITGCEYADGVFTQTKDAVSSEFALMWRAPKSKGGYSYVCLYKGVLAKDESSYKTKEDSIESSNVTLKGVFMPLTSNGAVYIKADSDADAPSELISTWFTKVPTKAGAGFLKTATKEK